LNPSELLIAPVGGATKLLQKVGWTLDQVDLIEITEAFGAQMLAIINELHLDSARVNVNGGTIALGHPIGASGARILTTLVHEMKRRGAKRGVASLCLGGGNGVALVVESL